MKKQIIYFSILAFALGLSLSALYFSSGETKSTKEGKWTRNACGFPGSWVHVNVDGMTYERALEVCRHEVFHEIWAECGESNNLTYCINKYVGEK